MATGLKLWRVRTAPVALIIGLSMVTSSAMAQTNVPNPLRGKPAQEKVAPDKPAEPKAEAARPDAAARPKRERSLKQKENDEIMRACGATWRAEKAALQAKGETWRSFLKDCRAKRKGEQKA